MLGRVVRKVATGLPVQVWLQVCTLKVIFHSLGNIILQKTNFMFSWESCYCIVFAFVSVFLSVIVFVFVCLGELLGRLHCKVGSGIATMVVHVFIFVCGACICICVWCMHLYLYMVHVFVFVCGACIS